MFRCLGRELPRESRRRLKRCSMKPILESLSMAKVILSLKSKLKSLRDSKLTTVMRSSLNLCLVKETLIKSRTIRLQERKSRSSLTKVSKSSLIKRVMSWTEWIISGRLLTRIVSLLVMTSLRRLGKDSKKLRKKINLEKSRESRH